MPDTVIAASLSLDSSQAERSVKSFKTQLRESREELIALTAKFGETSTEALGAARRVAELRDTIGDANEVAGLFDPGARFAAFGNVVNTVAGGFSALTGVLAIFDTESKDVEKTIQKLQAAMAISSGFSTIRDAIPQFQRLAAIIQQTSIFQKANAAATSLAAAAMRLFGVAANQTSNSFKLLKGAIAATGIGLLVVVIGEVVTALNEWTSASDRAAAAQKHLNDLALEAANKDLKFNKDFYEQQEKLALARAELAGKSEDEIFKIQQDYRRKKANADVEYYGKVKDLDSSAASESRKRIEDYNSEALLADLTHQKKQKESRQQAHVETKVQQSGNLEDLKKERLEAERSALEEIKKLKDSNYIAEITDEADRERAKVKQEYDNEKARITALSISAEAKRELLRELRRQEIDATLAIDEKDAESDKEKKDEEAKTEQQRLIDLGAASLGVLKEISLAKIGIHKDESELIKQTEEELYAYRKATIESFLANSASLFGKHTIAYKILAIAQAGINTYLGFSDALAAKTFTIFDTVVKFTNAGAILAAGIANVGRIAKVQVPGGGGSSPSLSASAPLLPQVATTRLDQQTIGQIGNAAAVKAYVVEADSSSATERISRINRAARIVGLLIYMLISQQLLHALAN